MLITVILLIGFTNCHKENIQNYDLNSYSIFWQESSAWADFYYKATIDQNGKLDIQEKYGLSNQYRESEFQISTEDMSLIKENLENILSIDISDEYGFHDNAANDSPFVVIIVSLWLMNYLKFKILGVELSGFISFILFLVGLFIRFVEHKTVLKCLRFTFSKTFRMTILEEYRASFEADFNKSNEEPKKEMITQ